MRAIALTAVLSYFLTSLALADDVRITLDKTFIESFRDRATINETCHIDKALASPHAQKDDGDLHIAARCDQSRLPAVIEIKNARKEPQAVAFAQSTADAHGTAAVHGVWRLWVEHANNAAQTHGSGISNPFNTTNPAHVYEIHPILTIGPHDVSDNVGIIPGFAGKDAEQAITAYERTRCELEDLGDRVSLRTTMVGFNHPKLRIQLRETPERNSANDGWHVFAELQDVEGELLARKRRLVLVDGTSAAARLSTARRGDNFLVMAMPRINLSLVSFRIRYAGCTAIQPDGDIVHSSSAGCGGLSQLNFSPDDVLRWDLPYELVVIAAFAKKPAVENTEDDPNE